MNPKLRADAEKTPLENALIVWLLGVGVISLPTKWLENALSGALGSNAGFVSVAVIRTVLSFAAAFLIYRYGFSKIFTNKPRAKSLILMIPALLVVVNNLPVIAIVNGDAGFSGGFTSLFWFSLYCFSVALLEELVFRGLIFPLCLIKFAQKKYCVFYAALLSSAVFGLSHLFNLFGGAGFAATLAQAGYSFLIGGMCAVALAVTGNVFASVILHFLFNTFGLVIEKLGYGSPWNAATVIITAALGAAVAAYMIVVVLKTDKSVIKKIL